MSDDSNIEDYSVSSAFSVNNRDAQMLVTIPGKVILDEILTQLGFPQAHYEHKICQDNKTCVAVTFNTTDLLRQGSLVPMTISGVRSMDVAVAEHTAAVAAIRYIENGANMVIKDLNYSRLKQLEKENLYLRSQLSKRKNKSRRLARGWFLSVRYMSSFSLQFHNTAILNSFDDQEIIHGNMKAAFLNVNGVAQRLKDLSVRLERKLHSIRRRP